VSWNLVGILLESREDTLLRCTARASQCQALHGTCRARPFPVFCERTRDYDAPSLRTRHAPPESDTTPAKPGLRGRQKSRRDEELRRSGCVLGRAVSWRQFVGARHVISRVTRPSSQAVPRGLADRRSRRGRCRLDCRAVPIPTQRAPSPYLSHQPWRRRSGRRRSRQSAP